MSLVAWCSACGQPLERHLRQSQIQCARCGGVETSPALLDAWRASFAARDARRLARLALWPPTLVTTRALRRCVKCETDHFVRTRACPRCGDELVGLDLSQVLGGDGSAESLLTQLGEPGWHFMVATLAVWLVALAFVARTALSYGAGRVALSIVYHTTGALLLQAAIVFVVRALRVRATTPLAGAPPPPTPGAVERARQELIVPYFERHGVDARGSVVPALREVDLLTRALAEKGLEVPPARMRPLLVACALLRDLERLETRLGEERDRKDGIDLLAAYARTIAPSEDAVTLPFLAELVADEQGLDDPNTLAPRLAAARDELRLRGFVLDLMQRRAAPGVVASLELIETMPPGKFEDLVAMLYEADGWRCEVTARGAHGADVLIERGDERLVVQARRRPGGDELGDKAVQEAVAAKAHYKVHRAIALTNATFAWSAFELASKAGVELIDHEKLAPMLAAFNARPKDQARLAALFIE